MAMLITSFTTACAFFSNTVNYVIPVGLFGAFMALLVVLNYILVCTMFPAAVVVYHFFLEDRTWKNILRWPKRSQGQGRCCPPTIYAPPSLSAVQELDDDPFTGGLVGAQVSVKPTQISHTHSSIHTRIHLVDPRVISVQNC